jgi:hypothetical protein
VKAQEESRHARDLDAEAAAQSQRKARRAAEAAAINERIQKRSEAAAELQVAKYRAQQARYAATGAADHLKSETPLVVAVQPAPALTEEEARRNVRRAIVTRRDTRWEAHGITKQGRQRWQNAGLRDDQAHIPAMCRVPSENGWRIMPEDLRSKLANGRTVQQEFEFGSNIIQVMDLLASKRKRDFPGCYDAALLGIAPVLRDQTSEMLETITAIPRNVDAMGIPKIADYLLGLTKASKDQRMIDRFNRERAEFQRTGRPGSLVKLYAEAHGVFAADGHALRLLQNVPLHVIERTRRPFGDLVTDALRERQFYFLSIEATLTVTDDVDGRIPIPEEYELPSPTGFAMLRDDENGGTPVGRILLWSHGAGELTAAILKVADLAGGVTDHPQVWSARVGAVLGENGAEALGLVAAIGAATRRPVSIDDGDHRPSGGTGRARPARKRLVNDSGNPADYVSLIYAPGETSAGEQPAGTGRKATSRWQVRGHYRQQPYPALGETRAVWIKAHEAGAAEGRLLIGDHVRVAR